jgi:hypothetical protein
MYHFANELAPALKRIVGIGMEPYTNRPGHLFG